MTATEKWDKEWFCNLSPKDKCIWDYLTHRCDNAGIWDINFGLMKFCVDKTGPDITEKDLEIFGERLIKFADDKVFIPSFISFQYGTLTNSCKPHIPVLAKLKKYGLLETEEFKGYKYPLERVKDKDKEKDKEKDIKERYLIFKNSVLEQEFWWAEICMKIKINKTQVPKAIDNFIAHCITGGEDHLTEKDFKTHFRNWSLKMNGNVLTEIKSSVQTATVGPDGQYIRK